MTCALRSAPAQMPSPRGPGRPITASSSVTRRHASDANDTDGCLPPPSLICHTGLSAGELNKWASAALQEGASAGPQAESLKAAWQPDKSWGAVNSVSNTIYSGRS